MKGKKNVQQKQPNVIKGFKCIINKRLCFEINMLKLGGVNVAYFSYLSHHSFSEEVTIKCYSQLLPVLYVFTYFSIFKPYALTSLYVHHFSTKHILFIIYINNIYLCRSSFQSQNVYSARV